MTKDIQMLEQHYKGKLKNLRADTFWIFYDLLDDFAALQLECDPESEITKEKLRNLATKFREEHEIVYQQCEDRINYTLKAGIAVINFEEGVTPNA